ncbi:hypothetical protein [Bacillus sp. KH172YL63]|uniref:hypothetical protein n=1 Tax=Bacillus sp. KH172YL63 TaxID=2709784 RepID=UPI0013E4AD1A|nr:hypothetical protein [Bacillus sp. KH172YL63]BCB04769.1 hypothetical protein KH172YL63_29020 [Bacillus sp. KH172YL63]
MNGVFTASRMMKASEVLQMCREAKKAPALLIAVELEAKEKLFKMKIAAERNSIQSA